MRVGSLFAGIGGFDLAAERVGMEVVWQSEIDKHASAVLDHHWPHVKNLGDIHGIRNAPAVDVLTGGFPCQDYSVAGTRGGLAGDRGALWWEYHRLITGLRPTWVVGENVPGLLSSRGGADFETIVGSLTELGYGVAWAVLDAQYFGVAQRRRRVFIVGHSGGVPRPEILALSEGVFGHPEPSREAGENTAPTLASRTGGGGFPGTDEAIGGAVVPMWAPKVAGALQQRDYKSVKMDIAEPHLVASGFDELNGELIPELHHSMRAGTKQSTGVVAFAQNTRNEVRDLNNLAGALAAQPGMKQQTYIAHENIGGNLALADHARSLRHGASKSYQFVVPQVRRLTPLECERLQGFPDGWTDIPGNSDTQRYRQLGNAVAVPVVEWIMRRIAQVGGEK